MPLPELEPAPDGVLLPGLELPPLPASPPEPGRAVPFVLAPLVPLGLEESVGELPDVDDGPLMVLPVELPLELVPLVAAIDVPDSAQVSAANASA